MARHAGESWPHDKSERERAHTRRNSYTTTTTQRERERERETIRERIGGERIAYCTCDTKKASGNAVNLVVREEECEDDDVCEVCLDDEGMMRHACWCGGEAPFREEGGNCRAVRGTK